VTLDKVATWFINAWTGLFFLVNLAAMLGFMKAAPTVWAGIAQIQEIYSPFNLWNWLAEVVSLLPALGVLVWRDRRRSRASAQPRK
jgi:hypothetical protein